MNESVLKHVSWASAVVALLCFLMPFVALTCSGTRIATVSGIELVTGGAELDDARKSDPSIPALMAFVSILVSLGLAIFKMRNPRAIAISAGISLFLTVPIVPWLTIQVSDQSHDSVSLEWMYGYFLTLLFVAASFVTGLVRTVRAKRSPAAQASEP